MQLLRNIFRSYAMLDQAGHPQLTRRQARGIVELGSNPPDMKSFEYI